MRAWPHAPLHCFNEAGTYMVIGATLNKEKFFKEPTELDLLHQLLLDLAEHYQRKLEAWAVFPNHYHFIAQSPHDSKSLGKLITHLHASSARKLNELHTNPGRKIWYQYWDSRITFQASYLAQLNYVMQNPVKHKIVHKADQYRWCSAHWFETNASKAYFETVTNLNTDAVNVIDEF
jgi:putative transposase